MNTPYLYKQTPQSSERYFGTLGDVSPPVIRIWNWTKPNLNGLTPFDPLHDVPTSTRDNLAAITERTHSALLMNVFSDIPADVLTDQSKYLYYARWYVDQLKYIRNDLRARVEYVELFSESNIGKPFDQRLARYRFFNTVAALIHQEIPSVKVGGMAECWPDPSIIGEFISQCGQNADFITWHLYPTGSVDTPIGDLLLRTNSFALASQRIAAENAARLPNRMLPQAITEYNINYNAWKPVDVRLSQGMGAVWTLSTLTNCLYSGALDWAYFWHFAGGAYGVLGDNIRPNGTLFSVLNHNLAGAKLCAARTSRADVECLAAKTDDGYVLALINKSTEAQTLHVDLLNYRPNVGVASVESWTTTGTDTTMPVTKSAAPAHRDGTFSLPPLSLRLMTIPAVK